MECGEVGCSQDREPDGPKIDASKAPGKKRQTKLQNKKIILHSITIFITLITHPNMKIYLWTYNDRDVMYLYRFYAVFYLWTEVSTFLVRILHVPYVRKV